MSASAFQGWLLRNPTTQAEFPHKLIAKDTYQSTPLQRIELKAYRDNNVLLHRVVSPNYKTKIEFSTIDKLTLAQLQEIHDFLASVNLKKNERKIKLEYWDDELLQYRTMNAVYQTDTTYPVSTISKIKRTIKYRAIKFTFIEY